MQDIAGHCRHRRFPQLGSRTDVVGIARPACYAQRQTRCQCDTFDPKPLAPEEIRGLFRPVATTVPSLHLTEALPRTAQQAHRIAVVRSVHHDIRCHNPAIYCSQAGREATTALAVSSHTDARRTDHPHYASVLARLRPAALAMPHHVIIPNIVYNGPARSPGLHGGYLGARYDPFILGSDPAAETLRVEGTDLPPGVDRTRFQGRQSLLEQFDAQCRSLDNRGVVGNVDTLYQRAFDTRTSRGLNPNSGNNFANESGQGFVGGTVSAKT
jgi:hypothetical protein